MRTKLLFICSRNQWRSPTAEALFKGSQRYEARSAGTSPKARVRVTQSHIRWADQIFVMERKHLQRLRELFANSLSDTPITILDIPDDFQFMDAELVDLVHLRLAHLLPAPFDPQLDLQPSAP